MYNLNGYGHLMSDEITRFVFMSHLALEKMLKAKVQQITIKTPPNTHDLLYFINLAEISLADEKIEEFMGEITNLSVPIRYPQNFQRMVKDFFKRAGRGHVNKD